MPGIINIELLNELAGDLEQPAEVPPPAIILEPDNFPTGIVFPLFNQPINTEVFVRPTGTLNVSSEYEFAEVQVTRNLNEHPTATATFYTTEIPTVNIGGPIQVLGINFIIDSYSINIYKGSVGNAIAVNLSLIGEHAPRGTESPLHQLDLPITFPIGTTQINWGQIQSRSGTAINLYSTGYEKYYSGQEQIILTPRAELEAASLLSVHPFIKYSTFTITSVPLTGIGSTAIPDTHIMDEVSQIEVKDKPIYKNVELTLDFDSSQVSSGIELETRFEYENCVSLADQVSPGGIGVIFVESIINDIKDPGNNFDNGGRTKTSRKITERNGNPLEIEETVYGYAFVSSQLFELPTSIADYELMQENQGKWPLPFNAGGMAASFWRIVQRTITTYNYDGDGYLISSLKTGWRLGRLKRETGEYEAANLWIDTFKKSFSTTVNNTPVDNGPSPRWKAAAREYNAYLFSNPIVYSGDNPVFPEINNPLSAPLFQYLINETSNYSLAPLTDYYPDIDIPEGEPIPKFAYKSYSYSNYQEVQPNPKDDPNDLGSPYPPLIAHKEKKESSTVQIIIPSSLSADIQSPEMYSVVDYTHSVEGDHSSSSLKIGNSTQYLGRPSTHTQLPINVPSNNLPDSYLRYTEQRYLLNSVEEIIDEPDNPLPILGGGSGFSSIPASTSTLSFSGALTPNVGKLGALNSLLRKSLSTVTTQIRVPFFEYYSLIEEGSKVTVSGTDYIVTGVSYSIKLYNPGEYYCPDGMNLSLAIVPSQSISIRSYARNDT